MPSSLQSFSRVSVASGLELSFGSAVELAGLRLTSTERALYNDVKRRLKRELMQGMGPYERPVVQERKSSTPATFEQRRAWASKKMLIPRLGGAGAMLRHYKAACEVSHPLRQRPVSMPQDLAAAVRYVSRKGAAVVQDRATRSAMLAGQAERLAPLHRRLCVLMPPHVAAISRPYEPGVRRVLRGRHATPRQISGAQVRASVRGGRRRR